jgi:hypothetical protein
MAGRVVASDQLPMVAPPLICLPAPSPREERGEGTGRHAGDPPLPVFHGGPKDGRDKRLAPEWGGVRGSANASVRGT